MVVVTLATLTTFTSVAIIRRVPNQYFHDFSFQAGRTRPSSRPKRSDVESPEAADGRAGQGGRKPEEEGQVVGHGLERQRRQEQELHFQSYRH